VSREHRRAKTDRLDTELLKRAFLGWLRGERDHCKMVAIPTIKNEDAKRLVLLDEAAGDTKLVQPLHMKGLAEPTAIVKMPFGNNR